MLAMGPDRANANPGEVLDAIAFLVSRAAIT